MLVILMIFLVGTGCSSVVKEKDIKEDLESYFEEDFLQEEKIEKITIDKRQTDKDKKADTIWCTVKTQDSKITYEKEMTLYYHKYEKDGWLLDEVELENSDKWEVTPLKGIAEEDIPLTLDEEGIKIDGESWEILESEVEKVSIEKQETDLKEKTDKVTVSVVLKGEIEQAKGKLTVKYKFDDKWELDKVLEVKDFVIDVIPEKALKVEENELIERLIEEKISCGDDSSMKQTITIVKDEISEFKIESQEWRDKGTEQKFHCTCMLNKANVVLGIQMDIPYIYEGEWLPQAINITHEIKEIDILGKWSGEYTAAGNSGNIVLDITKVEGNEISATYSFTPNRIDSFSQAGSYNVSGNINRETLNMNLTAGDWIEKPDKDAFIKQDIISVINVDMGIIEGKGHHGYVFRVQKQ